MARGENVCLDDLVPPSPAAVNSKQTARQGTKKDGRENRAITDVHTWLLAWNLVWHLRRLLKSIQASTARTASALEGPQQQQ